jgi:dihydroflavonol-4-reductase
VAAEATGGTSRTPAAPLRVFITGGTGFIGRRVVERLARRRATVVAAVRDSARAADLADLGVELAVDDLSDVRRLVDHMRGADAAVHVAGSYRVGIRRAERGRMWDANVGATTRFFDAAARAAIPRLLYVSTVNVFGNTGGKVVDEAYRRNLSDGFLSWYDETKYGAHEVVERRIADRAPVVVVLPSQVYGPGDHSEVGRQLRGAYEGTLRYRALDDVGFGLVHVEDLASGIVAALERGAAGESYILSGPTTTLGEAMALAAELGGRRVPRLRLPTSLLRIAAPLGRVIGQPNLREIVAASAGVTYWASSAKARRALDFEPRDLRAGFEATFAAT